MSSHRRRVSHFSRATGPRKALIRGLVVSLVEHGRITTTVEKAKEVRRHAEKLITMGKEAGTATRRLMLSRYPNEKTIDAVIKDIAPRFLSRPGGYTRIIKIGRRPGDTAEMAFLEFVDYDFNSKVKSDKSDKSDKKDKKGEKSEAKAEKKIAAVARRAKMREVAAKKKSVKRIQKQSRVEARS